MFCLVEHRGYDANEHKHKLEIMDKNITKEEYDEFMSNFTIYGQYHQFKEIYEICLESNLDLVKFLSVENLNDILRSKDIEREKVMQTGNKLLLNYCTVIKLMVEKIEAYLAHNQSDKSAEFKKLCSDFYDNNFAYRFFMRLRNYMIHNGMPFTKINSALFKDCNLYMSREHLLKWNGWNTVKNDLKKMTENDIAVQPLLCDIGACIYAVYMQSLYYLAPYIVKSIQSINDFHIKYGVNSFDFIEYETVEDLKSGNCKYHVVPINQMLQCIEELNKNPNINIQIRKI